MIKDKLIRLCLKVDCATVNLVLDQYQFLPGENVTGYFSLKGGCFEQTVRRLECDLITMDQRKSKEHLEKQAVTRLMSEKIGRKQSSTLPFSFQLPDQTAHDTLSYYFRTKLVFTDDTECVDYDPITILH